MHQFICKAQSRSIVPTEHNKRELFNKLLDSYQGLNMKFKVTIEVLSKDINQSQVSLYIAFIVRASEHFGNDYNEMEQLLMRFYPLNSFVPGDYKTVNKWNTSELNNFIDKANALLLGSNSDFKF